MRTRCRSLRVVAAVFLLLPLAACSPEPAAVPEGDSARRAHMVETIAAAETPVAGVITRTGTLQPLNEIKIFNQEEGSVTEMRFFAGDRVRKGEVLARLDDALLRAQLDKAEATRSQAEQDFTRLDGLVKRRLVAEEELARAKTALRVAQAEEALLRTRLDYTVIRAPFAGQITARLAEPGDVVPRYSHLFSLMDPASLITRVRVSELVLPLLGAGDAVEVRIDALPQAVWAGKIARIYPTVDDRTRQGTVEIQLAPVPPEARAGQLCRVTLRTPVRNRLLIPFAALRRGEQSEYVFVVDAQGKAQRRDVRSGTRHQDRIEVLEGLAVGDVVITKGLLGLKSGTAVTAVVGPGPRVNGVPADAA